MKTNIPRIMNPEPIQVEVQDLKGQVINLTVKTVTTKLMQDLTDTGSALHKDPVGTLMKQLSLLFGDEVDYSNFDMRVLRDAMSYCMSQVQTPNPIKRQDD